MGFVLDSQQNQRNLSNFSDQTFAFHSHFIHVVQSFFSNEASDIFDGGFSAENDSFGLELSVEDNLIGLRNSNFGSEVLVDQTVEVDSVIFRTRNVSESVENVRGIVSIIHHYFDSFLVVSFQMLFGLQFLNLGDSVGRHPLEQVFDGGYIVEDFDYSLGDHEEEGE
jgi:hypothetical protein